MMKKSMLKKTLFSLLLMIFFFTAILPMAGFDTAAFAVGPGQPDIDVMLKEYVELKAGETGNLVLTFKNNSTTTSARSLYFIPDYQNDKDRIFTEIKPVTEMPVKYLTSYDGKADIEISVTVDKFAQEGFHTLPFKLKYSYSVPEPPYSVETIVEMSVDVMIKNDKRRAKLVLESDASALATAGGIFELPVTLKNDGDFVAKDIKISLKGLSQDTFSVVSGSGKYNFDSLKGKETKTLKYSLRASSSFKTGSYPLHFSLEYTDERGNAFSEEQELWIPVSGSGGTGTVFEVLEITPSKTTVKPEDVFDVTVKVKNSGAYDSGQVKITAEGTSALLPVSQNLHIVQSIRKGETKVITFKFQPHPEAQRGGVPITIKVEPVDGNDGTAISQAISVFVDAETSGVDDPKKNIPKLIIKSYSSDPTLVNAGENFTLTMQFLNTHSTREVRNIKGSFSVTEGSNETGNVFTPVGSSNTFYIDKISPQNTAEWNVTLYTIPDAKSKTYTVTISFEYEDDLGTSHTASEIIGIPVYQPSRFEVSEISLPSDTFMGQPIYTMFEMYNLGKTEIYNVKLRVEGDFDAQPKSNYFGNFESGRVEYFELNLIPMTVGQASGRIIFQYEDASGEVHEVVKEISMNVMEMMMQDDGFPVDGPIGKPGIPGMEEHPAKSFFQSVWFYVIIGVVVVAIVVVIILIARKRKKNKEFDF
ncbi:MAG TPA: hypothetical protein GXX26_01200 [Clostridiaceae bacterium]|nr:hypothetical protein [Clostridiaceae bacterium]